MAMTTCRTLVLRGKTILADGTRFETEGGMAVQKRAIAQSPALVSVRHLYGRYQQWPANADPSAIQAGRSERAAGVLSRRSPASFAGAAVRSRWPHASTADAWRKHAV